jgi:hypothetical protein
MFALLLIFIFSPPCLRHNSLHSHQLTAGHGGSFIYHLFLVADTAMRKINKQVIYMCPRYKVRATHCLYYLMPAADTSPANCRVAIHCSLGMEGICMICL